MSVAFEKVAGVTKAEVSLNQGTVTLALKAGNKVTLEQVRSIIRKNGFTPKDAHVRAAGRLIERGGRPALELTGLDEVVLLDKAPSGQGEMVTVTGTIPPARDDAPPTMTVEDIAR